MSNYTQIVSYGPKDSLSHGDPNKALKGVQIDAELSAISTAIASKIDTPLQNIQVVGTATVAAALISGAGTTGQSYGLFVNAGTTSADTAFDVKNKSNSPYFSVRGDGHLFSGAFDFTPTTSTFVVTGTGFSSAVTGTATYCTFGPVVVVYFPTLTGPSNATTFTMTGIPPAIQMIASGVNFQTGGAIQDGGGGFTSGGYGVLPAASGTMSLFRSGGLAVWSAAGTKTVSAWTAVYIRV